MATTADSAALADSLYQPGRLIIFPLPRRGEELPDAAGMGGDARIDGATLELVSLFDACVEAGDVARSWGLLLKQLDTVSPAMFTASLNRYCDALIHHVETTQSTQAVRRLWEQVRGQGAWFKYAEPSTYARLCRALLSLRSPDQCDTLLNDIVTDYREARKEGLGEILAHVDILEPAGVQKLVQMFDVSRNTLPARYRHVFSQMPAEEARSPEHPLAGIEDALPTRSQSGGLDFLKSSLAALLDPNVEIPVDDVRQTSELGTSKDLLYDLARQKLLEIGAVESAEKRWQVEHDMIRDRGSMAPVSKKLSATLWDWHGQLVELIREEQKRIRASMKSEGRATKKNAEEEQFEPFLLVLSPEKLSVTTIMELLRNQGQGGFVEGVRTARALITVGRAVEREYYSERLQKIEAFRVFGRNSVNMKEVFSNDRLFSSAVKRLREVVSDDPNNCGFLTPPWSQNVRAKVGSVLVSLLLQCAQITQVAKDNFGVEVKQKAKAFYHTYQYMRGQRVGIIRFNDQVIKDLSEKPVGASLHPSMLPMLVPPRKWSSWRDGGYIYTESHIMRMHDAPEQRQYIVAASETGQLDTIYKALDVLGSTPWGVNESVFHVLLQVWNSGKAFPGIQPQKLDIESDAESKPLGEFTSFQGAKQRKADAIAIANNQSRRCDLNYKVEIARAFLKEKFYFPHNMDFRGRAYPLPSHFHHLGNDLTRGLLLFHEGRELGERGLAWLKIHMANLCGVDKVPLDERVAWTDANMDKILECADHPLSGSRWWTQFDDCWQALATCFELRNAIRSPDPLKYKSRLPVHQDGTCNGLQHYAALGGDLEGALQVNLEPSDRPQDVYSAVAVKVNSLIDDDASDPQCPDHERAKMVQGRVNRKVIKQTVMTNVYGVTFVGARAQIQSQLVKRGDIPSEATYELASYVARCTFKSLRSMFSGAHEIQDWLFRSASKIARSFDPKDAQSANMASVVWTTPLNIPIVQPYRGSSSKTVKTNLQNIQLKYPNIIMPVDSRRQATAFPPNFIHSLDATHMLLSALATKEAGIAFAAVHDSYWTHAADVDVMNRILRNEFVNLHSEDLMGKLKAEFEERYREYRYKVLAPAGSAEAESVLRERTQGVEDAKVSVAESDNIGGLLENIELGPDKPAAASVSKLKLVRGTLPLTFDDLPKRGTFDVSRVRDSKYFFS